MKKMVIWVYLMKPIEMEDLLCFVIIAVLS